MTKLGLLGDPHARAAPVAEALRIFAREKVDAIWCTGDVVGYGAQAQQVIGLLQQTGACTIRGNHEWWLLDEEDTALPRDVEAYLESLPSVIEAPIEGKQVYMVHASPPNSATDGIRLLAQDGQVIEERCHYWAERLAGFAADVLIVGHTHQVYAQRLANTLVINPGSSWFNHCCAVLSLPDQQVQWFALSGQAIRKTWYWGIEV